MGMGSPPMGGMGGGMGGGQYATTRPRSFLGGIGPMGTAPLGTLALGAAPIFQGTSYTDLNPESQAAAMGAYQDLSPEQQTKVATDYAKSNQMLTPNVTSQLGFGGAMPSYENLNQGAQSQYMNAFNALPTNQQDLASKVYSQSRGNLAMTRPLLGMGGGKR